MESLPQYKSTITEANVSAILGKNPQQSPQAITRMMVREWHGLAPEPNNIIKPCDQQQLAIIKATFEKETGMTISNGGHYQHPDNHFFHAWVDGFLADDIIDIHCPTSIRGNTDINAQDYLQSHTMHYEKIQFQLHCVGAEMAHFIIWSGESMDSTPIARDPDWMKNNKPLLNRFLSKLLKIVSSEKLSKPYLQEREYNAERDTEWLALAQQRLALKEQIDNANKTLKTINNQLIAFAKNKQCKVIGGGVQAFKVLRKGAVQYAKIPELKDVNVDKYRKKDSEYWSVR